MANDDEWIAEPLAEAVKQAPVTKAVATRMGGLIRTLLTDRSLTSNELKIAAKALLDDMAVTTSSRADNAPS